MVSDPPPDHRFKVQADCAGRDAVNIVQLLPALVQGGAERGTVELNRELVRRGIASAVISAGGRLAAQIETDGGRHITLGVQSKNPLTFFPRALQLRAAIRSIRPGLIHVRSRLPAWLLKYANAPLGIPVVSTVHGFNRIGRYSRVMTEAARIICVSSAVKDYVQMYYGIGDEKIAVIPRGIDASTFDPHRLDEHFCRELRATHGLEQAYVVAAVGRITPGKGLFAFVRALAQARRTLPNLVGLIVGDTTHHHRAHLQKLKHLAAELHAPIRFIGGQTRMAEIYALSDVTVSCAEKPETFGRTLVESLAMDRPVIATRHGGVRDIVREGIDGFLFTPGDWAALADLLVRIGEHEWRGLRASALARFSLQLMVEKKLAVYREALAGNRQP